MNRPLKKLGQTEEPSDDPAKVKPPKCHCGRLRAGLIPIWESSAAGESEAVS